MDVKEREESQLSCNLKFSTYNLKINYTRRILYFSKMKNVV